MTIKFVMRRYVDEHYVNEVAPAPDELAEKIFLLSIGGYHFGTTDHEFSSFLFVERAGADVAIEAVKGPAEYEAALTRLVEKAYDIAVHDTHLSLGLFEDPDKHLQPSAFCERASDAILKAPFTPFDTEGQTNED